MSLPTPKQKKLVQESWKSIVDRGALDSTGVCMFARLFTLHPDLLPLFPFGDLNLSIDQLKEHDKFKYHAGRVMKTVGTAVDGLEDLGPLVKKLESLGKRHKKYNVKPEYFQAVGEALISALSDSVGDSFDEDYRTAWVVVFGVVEDTMKKGLLSAE